MINNVLVLGGGSAGFLVAITLKHRHPDLRVTVLRSKEIAIIGVGESTTIPLVNHLHDLELEINKGGSWALSEGFLATILLLMQYEETD
jgi:glycine/D-amino acid oxidase-like deaminating enzyme